MEADFLQQTRDALKGQYHAGLRMLRQAIEVCPDDLWEGGDHPNQFWHVAYHGLFYTHLYLQPDEAAFLATPAVQLTFTRPAAPKGSGPGTGWR